MSENFVVKILRIEQILKSTKTSNFSPLKINLLYSSSQLFGSRNYICLIIILYTYNRLVLGSLMLSVALYRQLYTIKIKRRKFGRIKVWQIVHVLYIFAKQFASCKNQFNIICNSGWICQAFFPFHHKLIYWQICQTLVSPIFIIYGSQKITHMNIRSHKLATYIHTCTAITAQDQIATLVASPKNVLFICTT